jgi:hypothetical protein
MSLTRVSLSSLAVVGIRVLSDWGEKPHGAVSRDRVAPTFVPAFAGDNPSDNRMRRMSNC